jgi:[CysO sulfur-carrier protein]-S-L-cysteine hydrolase
MIRIPKTIHQELIAHAREGFPLEICGILGGVGNEVSACHRLTNIEASNRHFTMEPKEQIAVLKALREEGRGMLAIYHSHPESPARPSEEDIRRALTPRVSHLIVSLADPDEAVVKSFRIDHGKVSAEEIELI